MQAYICSSWASPQGCHSIAIAGVEFSTGLGILVAYCRLRGHKPSTNIMYLSTLALPIFGSAIAGLLGRSIGVTGAHIVTIG
jgi:hypothetical protein